MKAIFLNGPPNSGKDSIADIICARSPQYRRVEFKEPLIDMAVAISDLPYTYFEKRALKDVPHPTLNGLTPRQFLIIVSERWVKPIFGTDFFGRRALFDMDLYDDDICHVFSDSGFFEEALPIITALGEKNCLYVQVISSLCSWGDDSRSFWEEKATTLRLPRVQIYNGKTDFVGLQEAIDDMFTDFQDFNLQ